MGNIKSILLFVLISSFYQSSMAQTYLTRCSARNVTGGSVDHMKDAQKKKVSNAALVEIEFESIMSATSELAVRAVRFRGIPQTPPPSWSNKLEEFMEISKPDNGDITVNENGILNAESAAGYSHIWAILGKSKSPVGLEKISISGVSQIHDSHYHFGVGFTEFSCETSH